MSRTPISLNEISKVNDANGNGFGMARRREHAPLGLNAQRVVSMRYSMKDENGDAIESWEDIVKRVVGHVSSVEKDDQKRNSFYGDLSEIMLAREFIPNTPCLVNAGKPKGQLAACFVLGVPDSIEGIMEHAQNVAIIHQTGGGTGMTYEMLRDRIEELRATIKDREDQWSIRPAGSPRARSAL